MACSQGHPTPIEASAPDGVGSSGRGDASGDTDAAGDAAPPSVEVSIGALADLVRARNDEEAFALLGHFSPERQAEADLVYLRARLLERLERYSTAADALEPLPPGLPEEAEADARLRLVTYHARAGRCHKARLRYAELKGGGAGQLGLAARAAAARCALEQGDLETAVTELRWLSRKGGRGSDPIDLRLHLAEALVKSGKNEEAQETLRQALLSYPAHPQIEVAAQRLEELGGKTDFTLTERFIRSKRLLKERRVEVVLSELAPATRPQKRGQLVRWLHLRGMALYRTRNNYEEAAKVLAEAARLGGPTAIEDEFHAARALSRADKDDESIKAYRRFVKAHSNHELASEAEFLAAWLDLRQGRKRGEEAMKRFLNGPRAKRNDRLKRESQWHIGFRAFEQKQHAVAIDFLGRYAKSGNGGLIRGRGLYWQARALEAAGRRELAVSVYRRAIHVEALHWYALLARQRLQILGEDPGDPFPIISSSQQTATSPLPPIAIPPEVSFFSSLGFDQEAQQQLRRCERPIRASAPQGRELEALVKAYADIGSANRALRLAYSKSVELRKGVTPANRWIWEASYPTPYRQMVKAACHEQGVEMAHVYATMRQESGYRSGVVSHADAIGLLQMLPATAQVIAKRLNVGFRRNLLFDPNWNIRFGVAEIADLHASFNKQLPLTIAAYNAGEGRVRRWLKETGEVELDRFVEHIPFDETRNYTRRVTSHYARYKYLEDKTTPWALELPLKVGPEKAE